MVDPPWEQMTSTPRHDACWRMNCTFVGTNCQNRIRARRWSVGQPLGLGPGRRSRLRYSRTAAAVVSQLRGPTLTPAISPRRNKRRMKLGVSPLRRAASVTEMNCAAISAGNSPSSLSVVTAVTLGAQALAEPCRSVYPAWHPSGPLPSPSSSGQRRRKGSMMILWTYAFMPNCSSTPTSFFLKGRCSPAVPTGPDGRGRARSTRNPYAGLSEEKRTGPPKRSILPSRADQGCFLGPQFVAKRRWVDTHGSDG